MNTLRNKFENLQNALLRLKEGVEQLDNDNDLLRDGVIQRFEFTFELAWKTLKAYMDDLGMKDKHFPKDVLKEAFAAGIIKNEKQWLDMLTDRNATSHIYKEDMAKAICGRVRDAYVAEFEGLVRKLGDRIR